MGAPYLLLLILVLLLLLLPVLVLLLVRTLSPSSRTNNSVDESPVVKNSLLGASLLLLLLLGILSNLGSLTLYFACTGKTTMNLSYKTQAQSGVRGKILTSVTRRTHVVSFCLRIEEERTEKKVTRFWSRQSFFVDSIHLARRKLSLTQTRRRCLVLACDL